MRKIIFVLSVALVLSLPAYANNTSVNRQQNPDKLLEQGIHEIIGFLRQSDARDLNKILFFVNQNIASYFDFDYMTRLSAGHYGRQLTQAQITKLSQRIQTLFVGSLSSKLVDYAFTNREIRFLPSRRNPFKNQVTVHALVSQARGLPSRITFKFHPTPKGWKIYDLSANGQSAVLHYRQKIARLVHRQGIEALTR